MRGRPPVSLLRGRSMAKDEPRKACALERGELKIEPARLRGGRELHSSRWRREGKGVMGLSKTTTRRGEVDKWRHSPRKLRYEERILGNRKRRVQV